MTLLTRSISAVHDRTHAHDAVRIPSGAFQMGCADAGEYEKPIHSIFLDEFWIGRAPVTNREYHTFAEETGYVTDAERAGRAWGYDSQKYTMIDGLCWRSYASPERGEHPVVLVSWNDAIAYCEWNGSRLPSEAEWEKAARGGLVSEPYPWGGQLPDGTQSNFAKPPAQLPPTTPVGMFAPNAYGLVDMVGNVWQWCGDWYADTYYQSGHTKNPQGPDSGEYRVRRGGSWNVIQAFRLRCSNRGAMDPVGCAPNVGFRCVWSNPPEER